MKQTWFAIPALLALAACDSISGGTTCPAVISPAVNVTAVDSLTNVNLTAGSTLVLSNVLTTDSLDVPAGPATTAGIGPNRTGTFILRVRRPGYQLWQKPGVTVTAGRCGPRTVEATARLEPIGPGPQ